MNFKSRIASAVKPSPVEARHSEYSMLLSADDGRSGRANACSTSPSHYKLLVGLVKALGAKSVVEIGTATGRFKTAPIVMFDDIRLWNMLAIWWRLDRPKLDLTSFWHWSGTGLVDWTVTK